MKRITILLVLLVLVLVGGYGYRLSQAQQAGSNPGSRMGVIDMAKVLSECQEALDREKLIGEKRQAVRSKLSEMAEEASNLRQELENVLKPGTAEYHKQLQKWFDQMALQEAYEKGQTQAFTADAQAWMEVFYQKVEAEVAALAQQQGFSLVLDKDRLPLTARSASELSALIRTRKVIYADSALDLTSQVMEKLDAAYQREKAAVTR